MARDITITYSARDQISPALNSMRASNSLFNKDLEETRQKIDALVRQQDALAAGLSKSRGTLNDTSKAFQQAKKEYEKYGEALGKDYLNKFQQENQQAKQSVKELEGALKEARNGLGALSGDVSRAEGRAGGLFGGLSFNQGDLTKFAESGLGKMLGDSVVGATKAGLSSALGDATGSAISTTLSGTLNGAMAGAGAGMIFGLPGAAVGAIVGTVTGVIDASFEYFKKKDEAFISTRNGLVPNILERDTSGLERGLMLDAAHEGNLRKMDAFGVHNPTAMDQSLSAMSRATPHSYDTTAELLFEMMGGGASANESYFRLPGLADMATALNLSDEGLRAIVGQLESARSGPVDMNTLQSLESLGIDPYGALAEIFALDGKELTQETMQEHLPNIDVSGFIDALYRSIGDQFEGSSAMWADTYEGLEAILQAQQDESDRAYAQAFKNTRAEGMKNQVAWNQEFKDEINTMNQVSGAFEASQLNKQEEINRLIQSALYTGDASMILEIEDISEEQRALIYDRVAELAKTYQEALANGDDIKAEEAVLLAGMEARIAYAETDGAKLLVESQKVMIDHATEALKESPALYEAAFALGQAYGKGMLSGIYNELQSFTGSFTSNGVTYEMVNGEVREKTRNGNLRRVGGDYIEVGSSITPARPDIASGVSSALPGNAWGLPYVPRNDYIARLHEGERVLTAQQARAQDAGSGAPTINIHNPVIREEPDIYRIAQTLAAELRRAQLIS